MKPNITLTREAILTLIVIFLLGIAILVSIVLLAFLFSGNSSELKSLLPPTRVHPTAASFIPTEADRTTERNSTSPTLTASTAVLPTSQSILPPTSGNTNQTPDAAIPTPDYSEALAEIGVLDTSRSANGAGVIIKVSVYNFGKLPFTLSKSNVTLTQSDGKALALNSSNPNLPQEVKPGETKTIELDFELPSSPTATLKILTLEFDIEGY